MKKAAIALLALCLATTLWAQDSSGSLKLKPGDTAPDFTLLAFDGKDVKAVSLHDFKGKKNVVLAFYVFAFTGGWTTEMRNFQQNLEKLEAADTQVLGISIDSPFANYAFGQQNGIQFPLLGDPSGTATRAYGLLKPIDIHGVKMDTARRATFLIDKDGKITETQVDKDAVDPTKIVTICERKKKAS